VNSDGSLVYGAFTAPCNSFQPSLPGGECTFVPPSLEKQAAKVNADPSAATIDGRNRFSVVTELLQTLTHETEHARFEVAPALAKPSPTACDFNAVRGDLSELVAIISEFNVRYHRSLAFIRQVDRQRFLDQWFAEAINNPYESINGNLKSIRCQCECNDADAYIKKSVESTTSGWDTYARFLLNAELQKPKWKLNWPVDPPTVDPKDIPPQHPEIEFGDIPTRR
jgi:hypothetical protein